MQKPSRFQRIPNDPMRATQDHLRTDKPREIVLREEAVIDRLFGHEAVPTNAPISQKLAAEAIRELSGSSR